MYSSHASVAEPMVGTYTCHPWERISELGVGHGTASGSVQQQRTTLLGRL